MKPLSEILNMGSNGDVPQLLPKTTIQSHLSPRSRSLSNFPQDVKRVKPNKVHENSLQQLELPKKEVHEVIDDILNNRPLKNGFQFYYQKVESICKFKHSEQSLLSDYLKEKIEGSFYDLTLPNIETIVENEMSVSDFIADFLKIYQDWEDKLVLLRKIFLYIDRNYLLQHPTKKVILELGLGLFIDNVLTESKDISSIIINKYLQFLHSFIQQDTEFEDLIRMTKILIKLNFNNSINLDEKLIDLVCKNFESFKHEWIRNPDTYIHLCLLKILKVTTFFKHCGQSNDFVQKLLIKLRWIMIFQDFNDIVENCLPFILKKPQQMKIIYGFCNNTMRDYSLDSLKILVFQWGKLILNEIIRTIDEFDDNDKSKNLIITVNGLSIYYNSIIEQFFNNDNKFSLEVRNSFGKALNSNKKINNQIISQLCKFIDTNIKNFKKASMNFDEFLEIFLTIFKYLNNKNDFVIIFKRELSRRLLLNKNSNINLEKQLVEKIMEIIGETDDSVGLNIMFKDLEISKLKYTKLDFVKEFEFTTLVLDKKHWPEIPKQQNDINLNYFQHFLDKFDEYYKSLDEKLKNHKLNWDNYSLHQLTIVGKFESGEYELSVNLYQALIINLFNDRDQWDFKELVQETRFDTKFLKRVINSLSDKYKILIEHDQTITFNNHFTDKSKKLKIPMFRDKESSIIEDKLILKNRNNEIRSNLIKIMKVETKLPMTELINKLLVNNKRGPISIQDIKQNIEYLITNEFLTRDNDGTTLVYIP